MLMDGELWRCNALSHCITQLINNLNALIQIAACKICEGSIIEVKHGFQMTGN